MSVRVSIVVPTYRRPHLLDRCLAALCAQDYSSAAYEIVVADDGNDAATRQLIATRSRDTNGGPAIRYIAVTDRHGPAAARNAGWYAARGEIIAFTDDDCIPNADWLRCGVAALDTHTTAVWGRIVVPLPADPTDYERDAARLQSAGFVTANCFCRRSALEDIGGLDENFTAAWREDSDLYFTLLKNHHRVAPAPAAIVVHPVRPAPWGASLRQQRKILFDALLYKKHRDLYRRRIRAAPPWRYYAILISVLAAVLSIVAGQWAIAAVSGLIWLALTLQFFRMRLRDTSRRPLHVIEMALTSALIPPLAVFWRMVGAFRFRVVFL